MKKNLTKAVIRGMIASLMLVVSLPMQSTKASIGEVDRVGESDRYKTATKIATTNWTTSRDIVLVCGEGYADAISAAPLAKQLNAPVLLTNTESLNSDTEAALGILKPTNIYVIGGTASVAQSVREQLKSNSYKLVELSGKNRYETNIEVAKKLIELGAKADDVMLVGGEGFSDALSVVPIAAAKGKILLLGSNDADSMKPVYDFVKANNSKVKVIGTKNVINEDTMKMLGTTDRVDGGVDRFDTNLKILEAFKSEFKMDKVFVANATGDGYADALLTSALAGKSFSPLVLVDTEGASATTNAADYIKKNATKSTELKVVGGAGVVSDTTVKSIKDTVNSPAPSAGSSTNTASSSNSSNRNDHSSRGDNSSPKNENAVVNIPDAKLKEVINKTLGKDRKADAQITKSEMESIKELVGDDKIAYLPDAEWAEPKDTLDRGIKSIEGLQYAVNLEKLDLSENRIKDLTPLKNLTKLTYVELDRNMLGDLTPLSNLTNLVHLNIYNNDAIVDMTAISKLSKLEWLDLHFCNRGKQTVNVAPLGEITTLKMVNLESDLVEDISFAKKLINVQVIGVGANNVTDMTPLSDMINRIYYAPEGSYEVDERKTYVGMYGQNLREAKNINAGADGAKFVISNPVKGLDQFIKNYYDVTAPVVNFLSGQENENISLNYNEEKREIEVTVNKNETKSPREIKTTILLDYGKYALCIKLNINQEAVTAENENEVVNIPDVKLKEVINKTLGKDRKADAQITKSEMESIKELVGDDKIAYLPKEQWAADGAKNDTHDRGIKSIDGLQYAVNLEKLDLSENRIKDLTPLKNLTKLTYVELDRNMLGDLTPLSNLTNLVHLNIYNNDAIVDMTAISKFPKLEWLDLHFCNRGKQTVNVAPLGDIATLKMVNLESDLVEDISFANKLINVQVIGVGANNVTDMTPLSDMINRIYYALDGSYEVDETKTYVGMYGQNLRETKNINAGADGGKFVISNPVKGLDQFIKNYYDVTAPNVSFLPGEENENISLNYNEEKREIEVTVNKNEAKSPREIKTTIFLDYGKYALSIKLNINQDAAN